MLQSITTAPHIYLDLEIDMTEAERCRQSIGRSMEAQGEPASIAYSAYCASNRGRHWASSERKLRF